MADNYSGYYNQASYNYGSVASSTAGATAASSFGVDPQSTNPSLYAYQGSYADPYGMSAQQQYQQQYQQMPQYQTPQPYQPPQAYQPPQPYQAPDQYQQQQQQQTSQAYGYLDPSMYSQAAAVAGGQDYYNYSIQQMAYQQLQQSYESQSSKKDDTISSLQTLSEGSKKKEVEEEGVPVFGVDLSKQAPEDQQNHMQQQMQQQLQQAFEKQIHQQIHQMVLQKLGQPAGNSDGRTVFGEDSVGVRSGGASSEVVGGVGSDGKSKYYCSTCDINYANSLAFTSHLGSREHKVQKERLDKDPGYREDFMARVQQKQQQQLMQQQQQATVRSLPGKKQLQCRLCNVSFNGAELYAVHIKSYEHQQVLKMNRDSKAKMAMYSRPVQTSFGVDLNPSKSLPYPEPSSDGLGLEFIEELKDEAGQVIRVFCNLCKFDIDNEEMKMLHLNGQKHSTLYKERMEKYQGGYMGAGPQLPGGGQQGPAAPPQMQHIIQQQLDQQLQQALPQLNLPAGQQDAFVQQVNMQVHSMLQQSPFMKQYEEQSTAAYPPMSQYSYPPNGPPPYPYNPSDYPPPPPSSLNYNRPPVHFGMSPPSGYPSDAYQDQPMFGISLHGPPKKAFGVSFNRTSKTSSNYPQEIDDDNDLLVKEKHTLVYPTSKQFNAVRKVLADAEKWLKQVQQQQQQQQLPTTIKQLKRINTVAKGLLSTTDLDLDLLVLTSDWPTYSFVGDVYQALKTIINESEEAVSYDITMAHDSLILKLNEIGSDDDDDADADGKKDEEKKEADKKDGEEKKEEGGGDDEDAGKKGGADDDGGVAEKKDTVVEERAGVIICQIHFACDAPKDVVKEDGVGEGEEGGGGGGEEGEGVVEVGRLSKEVVQSSLKQLQHTKWFQTNANRLPSCVMVLRVVRAVCKAHPVLSCIQEQAMELLMAGVLSAYNSAARPGQAFKFFIEALCQGVLMGQGASSGGDGGGGEEKGEAESGDGGGVDTGKNAGVKEGGGDGVDEGGDGGGAKVDAVDAKDDEGGEGGGEKKDKEGGDVKGDKEGDSGSGGGGVKKESEDGNKNKYEFVVDKDLMTSWWKRQRDDDDEVLVSMTTESKEQVTEEAKKMLQLIQKGDMHVILGLEKRLKVEKEVPAAAVVVADANGTAVADATDTAVVDAVTKEGDDGGDATVGECKRNGDEKEGGKNDEMEVGNSPRDDEEEDDGYIPSKKRQKFSFEKQPDAK